ncbi:MAG: hypothetical protein ACFCAD_04610 [Pleurocapsa sp.]
MGLRFGHLKQNTNNHSSPNGGMTDIDRAISDKIRQEWSLITEY